MEEITWEWGQMLIAPIVEDEANIYGNTPYSDTSKAPLPAT